MHELLFKYFKTYTSISFSDGEIELIKSFFVPKKFRKHQYFLQEGEVNKQAAFIIKGAMRQYTVDEKGVEHISDLYLENWWAADRESVLTHTPSAYFIDAWEETETLITKTDFTNLFDQIPALNDWSRKMNQKRDLALRKRLNAAINMSAEDRYTQLEQMYPEFIQRFPQHIIASYLGINKVTLSRIRSHAMKKSRITPF